MSTNTNLKRAFILFGSFALALVAASHAKSVAGKESSWCILNQIAAYSSNKSTYSSNKSTWISQGDKVGDKEGVLKKLNSPLKEKGSEEKEREREEAIERARETHEKTKLFESPLHFVTNVGFRSQQGPSGIVGYVHIHEGENNPEEIGFEYSKFDFYTLELSNKNENILQGRFHIGTVLYPLFGECQWDDGHFLEVGLSRRLLPDPNEQKMRPLPCSASTDDANRYIREQEAEQKRFGGTGVATVVRFERRVAPIGSTSVYVAGEVKGEWFLEKGLTRPDLSLNSFSGVRATSASPYIVNQTSPNHFFIGVDFSRDLVGPWQA